MSNSGVDQCVRISAEDLPEDAPPLYIAFHNMRTMADDRGKEGIYAYGDESEFRRLSQYVLDRNPQMLPIEEGKQFLITSIFDIQLIYGQVLPREQVFFYSGTQLLQVANAETGHVVDFWNNCHILTEPKYPRVQ